MKEKWKDIKGYEGIYQISNFGRVKSLQRTILSSHNGSVYEKAVYPRVLHPNSGPYGYLQVSLNKNGKCVTKKIHRLVAEHFLPNPNRYQAR